LTINIWDLKSEKKIVDLKSQNGASELAFRHQTNQLYVFSKAAPKVRIFELAPKQLIRQANSHNALSLSHLSATQLAAYNLESLLDLYPSNESKLIATRETWQIKAFADLAAKQAEGSNILSRVEAPYARANRLYTAALVLQDEPLIRMDYAKMLRNWAAVYRDDGQEPKAKDLETRADKLWKP
jgi:hypothetical protein